VFCRDDAQRQAVRAAIDRLTAAGTYAAPVLTQVEGAVQFWPAEDHHVAYYEHNPLQPYCMAVVAPKVAKLRKLFAGRVKTQLR